MSAQAPTAADLEQTGSSVPSPNPTPAPTRSDQINSTAPSVTIHLLPNEIFTEILSYLSNDDKSLSHLTLTCHSINKHVAPILYTSITFRTNTDRNLFSLCTTVSEKYPGLLQRLQYLELHGRCGLAIALEQELGCLNRRNKTRVDYLYFWGFKIKKSSSNDGTVSEEVVDMGPWAFTWRVTGLARKNHKGRLWSDDGVGNAQVIELRRISKKGMDCWGRFLGAQAIVMESLEVLSWDVSVIFE